MPRELGEERWRITKAHPPQQLGDLASRVFGFLAKSVVRHGCYAFDEASRFMPCFNDIAPCLDVLIDDEFPLAPEGSALLRPGCVTQHRSWVANFVPHESDFNPEPEEKIYFLGSQMGLARSDSLGWIRARRTTRWSNLKIGGIFAGHDNQREGNPTVAAVRSGGFAGNFRFGGSSYALIFIGRSSQRNAAGRLAGQRWPVACFLPREEGKLHPVLAPNCGLTAE